MLYTLKKLVHSTGALILPGGYTRVEIIHVYCKGGAYEQSGINSRSENTPWLLRQRTGAEPEGLRQSHVRVAAPVLGGPGNVLTRASGSRWRGRQRGEQRTNQPGCGGNRAGLDGAGHYSLHGSDLRGAP